MPTVYVIAGANGAGKTTFAAEFLPAFVACREFLNADLIAAGLSPFRPESQRIRAGRLLLARMHELAAAEIDFGFETTLAGRGHVRTLADLKQCGYQIQLFFLWLPAADLAVARVANRARQGGHDVPETDVRRRWAKGWTNFLGLYRPLADAWRLYDAARLPPALIAAETGGNLHVAQPGLYNSIVGSPQE